MLAKYIVEPCVERSVGRITVGGLSPVPEHEDGNAKNWGPHGNLNVDGWTFDRFTSILDYNAKVEGIEVSEVSERDTSKTCCVSGREDD